MPIPIPIGRRIPTTLVVKAEDERTKAPVRNVMISVHLGQWRAEMGEMAQFLEYTDNDGLVTITLPDLTGPEQAKRFNVTYQPGGWPVTVWVVTLKDGTYTYPPDKGSYFKVWVWDNRVTRFTVPTNRKPKLPSRAAAPAGKTKEADRKVDDFNELMAVLAIPGIGARATKGLPKDTTRKRFENTKESDLMQLAVNYVGTVNDYVDGVVDALETIGMDYRLQPLKEFQSRWTDPAIGRVEKAIWDTTDETLLLRGVNSAARITQLVTLVSCSYDVIAAFQSGNGERVAGAMLNAATHIGMSTNPITGAIDALLSVTIGSDWPAKIAGLKGASVSKIIVWTSHNQFTVEHHLRDSVLAFENRGGSSCLADSKDDSQCRIHYVGWDRNLRVHQWAAVHYKKGLAEMPGLAFTDKGLTVILPGFLRIPLTESFTKDVTRNGQWVEVYDAIYRACYLK